MLDNSFKQANTEFLEEIVSGCLICLGSLDLELVNDFNIRLIHENCIRDMVLKVDRFNSKKNDLIFVLLNSKKINLEINDNATIKYAIASATLCFMTI